MKTSNDYEKMMIQTFGNKEINKLKEEVKTELKEEVKMDYKKMCVQQGYVPSTCKLDGQLIWLLINDGKDPCKGCNHDRNECNGRNK